jgi:hypothetical protein
MAKKKTIEQLKFIARRAKAVARIISLFSQFPITSPPSTMTAYLSCNQSHGSPEN